MAHHRKVPAQDRRAHLLVLISQEMDPRKELLSLHKRVALEELEVPVADVKEVVEAIDRGQHNMC